MKKVIYHGILLGSVFLLMHCKAKKPVVTKTPETPNLLSIAQKRWPAVSQEELDRGQTVYNTKCTGCHRAKPIAGPSEEKWINDIDRMSSSYKANLSLQEKQDLTHYILAAREAGVK